MKLNNSLLLTDLYQLTMLEAYFKQRMSDDAVFEFFVRKLPTERNFLLASGLEQLLEFLESLHLSNDEYAWLKQTGRFSDAFIDFLAELRFTGDVHAMAEGTVFFPNEPIVSVRAPIAEAQLVESRLVNLLHFQTLVASKAARCVLAAPGKLLVDFGLRRAHGAEAGLLAARASYIAGFAGSATVQAGQLFDVPIFGTVAHSFIQAHDSETQALENFARSIGGNVTLLIDTYDTEAAAHKVVELAPQLRRDGIGVGAVRLDSGDLAEHAKKVRQILNAGGLHDTQIFASGGIDEYKLQALHDANAPIDGYGVGTQLDTSADAPYFDCAYKLTEYAGRGRRKHSEAKATWPGRKQVFRSYDNDGGMCGDVITLHDDKLPAEPLLNCVMRNGMRVSEPESLAHVRHRVQTQLAALPGALRTLDSATAYPVTVSQPLRQLAAEVDRAIAAQT